MEKKSKLKLKGILFSILVTLQISLISAQGILNRSLSNDLALGEAIAALNYVLLWEITTWLDLTLFIASWAGFYFATRPLLLEIYGVILDNFPTSSRRNRYSTTDDGEPIGMKGLALTSSFVTTQIVGGIIGFIAMIAIGAIGLFIFAYTMIKGTPNYMKNLSNQINGANGGGRTRGSNGGQQAEEYETIQQLNQVLAENEQLREQLEQVRNEEEDDEDNLGDEEGPDEAESNITQQLEQLEQIETRFNEIESELEQIEEEIRTEENQTDQEEQELSQLEDKIRNQQRELHSIISRVVDVEDNLEQNEGEVTQLIKDPSSINENSLKQDLAYSSNSLNQIEEMFEEIHQMEQTEFQELRTAIEDEKVIVSEIERLENRTNELKQEIEELIENSKLLESVVEGEEDIIQKTERLAREIKDKEDYQNLEEDERVLEDVEGKLNSILNKEQTLKGKMQEIEEHYENEKNRETDLLQDLENLEASFEKTLKVLKEIGEKLVQFDNEVESDLENFEEATRINGLSNFSAVREDENQRTETGGEKLDEAFKNHIRKARALIGHLGYNAKFEDLGYDANYDSAKYETPIMSIMEEMYDELGMLISEIERE
jgi:chromosome segregation ATPase